MSTDPLAEIRASFFVECEDLIESLHDALARLDAGLGRAADDPETDAEREAINVVFRAVHSIKGGAAAFLLDALVGYAHRLESVLDALRSGGLPIDSTVVGLLQQAADMLSDHVRAAATDSVAPGDDTVLTKLEALTAAGQSACGIIPEPAGADAAIADFAPIALQLDLGSEMDAPLSATRRWHIALTPRAGLYHSGNEVQHLLRALASLGRARTECLVPDSLSLDPDDAETPKLAWIVRLEGEVERAEIDDVFDFVNDVCDVAISEDTVEDEPDAASVEDDSAIATAFAAPVTQPSGASVPTPPAAPSLVRDEGGATPVRAAQAVQTGPAEPAAPVSIRVDLDKIDRLLNLVSELVINQSMLAESVEHAGLASPDVVAGLDGFLTLTRDIQDGVMSVRAQPVKPLFQRMGRIVREAGTSTGKSVRLRTEGDATEVDKTLIERLADPLTHIIRNAVDHGIEEPAARARAGKPAEGLITLSAHHRAGRILIEVSDDGAGIDRKRVRATAVARGLIAPDAVLTDAETDNLLFLPGFSTAEKVSSLSGRGVGMDVVRSAIGAIGGRITLSSERGRGTTIAISLPLTLAVLDGMVVAAGGQTFVIPLSSIVETARMEAAAVMRVGPQTELLQMRGELIPLIDLAGRLGFRNPDQPSACVVTRTGTAGIATRGGIVLMTTQDDGTRAALIVDAIMEPRQVVIKGLGQVIGPIPGVAAATILGGGQVALILDPSDLTMRPAARPVPAMLPADLPADLPLAG